MSAAAAAVGSAPLPAFWSMYSCAFRLSGNAGRVVGMMAPFCTRSSAMGKEVVGLCWPDTDRECVAANGAEEAGFAAGSAAARARKTECVLRDRSAALAFAWFAKA